MSLGMLIAYDVDGNVVATLDYAVSLNPDKSPRGLIDFIGHEAAGLPHTSIWRVSNAAGSKAWPEWLGSRAHEFRVERDGPPGDRPIVALVHKLSGHRRERATVEQAITDRITAADGAAADIRDLVGGPDRPLPLEPDGRTGDWTPLVPGEPGRGGPQAVRVHGDAGE